MKYLDNIVPNIMETLSTLIEGVDYIRNSQLSNSGYLLIDMDMAIDTLINSVDTIRHKIVLPNKITELQKNIKYSFKRILSLYTNQNYDELKWRFDCEFTALILSWQANLQFYLIDGVDEDSLKESFDREKKYIEDISKVEKKDLDNDFKYEVSIVVLFYNNKEMTKQCIDSILKYSNDVNYELITINNGSDEETTNWCEALSHKKKIHFKYNMGPTIAGCSILDSAQYTTEGKFTVYVSNDVIVTENWLKNLLKCIKSDDEIGWAAPVCNSLSNMQTIQVAYESIEQMQEFAKKYNISDENKWEERARLFPFLAIIRPWVLETVGGYNSQYFCYDMFADDDMSMKIRRAGYKQILCKDTFVHHYGSATIKDNQYDVMEMGRKQFYNKYGIDAWDSLGFDNFYFANYLKASNYTNNIDILIINPKFGETLLAFKNKLKNYGCENLKIDSIVDDNRYLYDSSIISDKTVMISETVNLIQDKQYDYILLNGNIEEYNTDVRSLLLLLKHHIKPNGYMMLMSKNPYYYSNILNFLCLRDLNVNYRIDQNSNCVEKFIPLNILQNELMVCGYNILEVLNINDFSDITGLIRKLSSVINIDNLESYKNNISISRYLFIVK